MSLPPANMETQTDAFESLSLRDCSVGSNRRIRVSLAERLQCWIKPTHSNHYRSESAALYRSRMLHDLVAAVVNRAYHAQSHEQVAVQWRYAYH